MSPKHNRDHGVLSWRILAFVSIEGAPKEAILLNRVCGCGRKWHHWIREVWGYPELFIFICDSCRAQ